MERTEPIHADNISPEDVAKVRNETAKLLNAFREKHDLEPDDAGIEVRKIGDVVVVMVRKLSVAEREWRDHLANKKNLLAIAANEKRPVVYGYVTDLSRTNRFLLWLKRSISPAAVFLTEIGARREGGPRAQIYKMEVRA